MIGTNITLEVKEIAKYFGGVRALDGVSIKVPNKGIVGLIGPNGSGKTTLFNVITGFYLPTKGEVWFKGERIDGLNPNEVFLKGLVRTFQIPRLFKSLTVLENVLVTPPRQIGEKVLYSPLTSKWVNQEESLVEKAVNLLHRFGLGNFIHSRISELSAAHIKMIETLRGLITNAYMYLLDEPAAGVAYNTARELFTMVKRLRDEEGLTFLIIEHRLEVLMDFVDYVYVLHNGKLLAEGTPREVMNNPKVIQAYLGG